MSGLFDKGLTVKESVDLSKLKAFMNSNLITVQMEEFVSFRVVHFFSKKKGKYLFLERVFSFTVFPKRFQKSSSSELLKVQIVW